MKRKNKFLLALVFFSPLGTQAKGNFYFAPSIQVGYTNTICTFESERTVQIEREANPSYGLTFGFSYNVQKLRLYTGLSIFSSGANITELDSKGNPVFVGEPGNVSYWHAAIPLTVGYRVLQSKIISLYVNVGAAVSINPVGKTSDRFIDMPPELHLFSAWSNASFLAVVQAGKKISFTGGPRMDYMVTNFAKGNIIDNSFQSKRNYIAGAELGINIKI